MSKLPITKVLMHPCRDPGVDVKSSALNILNATGSKVQRQAIHSKIQLYLLTENSLALA